MTLSLTGMDIALPHPEEHFIGGSWQTPASDARVTVISPNDESAVANLPDFGTADVDKAVAAARMAFDDGRWSDLPVSERITALRRFTDGLLSRSKDIGLAWSLECGATAAFRDAINGIVAPTVYENNYGFAESVPMSEERTGFAGPVTIVREPYGVVVAILTYNGPLAYLGMKVLPALLSGNVVVLKLPLETRLVAQYVAEAAAEADLPAGVLSVIATGTEASRYLVEHRGIDMVSFTGGTAVGAQILHSTADRVVRTTLELGGKSAGIVADDIDMADLLPALLPGLLPFQGQVCVALTRLLVSRERHDEIVAALTSAFTSVKIGSAMDPSSDFGPVAVSRTRDRCERFVAGAIRDGATVACGGKRPDGLDRGWYYEPTLLTGVKNSMEIAQEEVFGPVFTVLTYDDIDDAVRIANDSKFGLTAAMFTNDRELARSVGMRIRAGSFTVNSTGGVLGQPFGGYKLSGIGREMGLEGYLEWSQTKSMKISSEGNYLAG